LSLVNSKSLLAESLYKVQLDEDQIILLDVKLNNATITRSIDVYQLNNKLMLAVEPLFDALKIRYAITDNNLSIWKGEQEIRYELNENMGGESHLLWASDDFYFFTELALVKKLFPAKIEFIYNQLELKITTAKDNLLFPIQILTQQATQRSLNRFAAGRYEFDPNVIPITIADEYRLFTVPHGRVLIAAETDKDKTGINGSVQLVSDFLYHSANLTISDNNNSDFAARLVLSRYKTAPNKPILGLYDQYQLGDVSSITNGISTQTNGGIGFQFKKLNGADLRQTNQAINLQEIAPPGWEAELFRNNIFLAATTVPNDGLLNFDDVELEYGANNYEIKLYGPYGETQIRKKTLDLTQNALTKGQFTHGVYALDSNHRLINDQSDEDYKFTDYGATIDYGITDNWQIGFGFAGIKNDQQFYNLTNALSLPGILLENDLSVDQDGNYAQITSVKGSLFERDTYSLVFRSSDDFVSDRTQTAGKSTTFTGAYSKPTDFANINFSASYSENDFTKRSSLSNRISKSVGKLLVRHDLSYTSITSNQLESNAISGVLGLSGSLPYGFRISANINYQPEEEELISKSSSLILQKSLRDPWDGFHSFNINYLPLVENTSSWRLGHRAAWQADEFQLNVSTTFDEQNKWSFQLGIQLFLGYDYRNNKLLLNQNIQSNTATLDVHTYLDRQLNGVHDPLDYNLTDVEFYGNPEWASMGSGENGRTILPGVTAVTPFSFGAKWKQGSNTINNDYVVYTHPGAYIDVNMPFVLSTDLVGFVLRTRNGQEVGIQNISIALSDQYGEVLQTIETDLDGYYEFNGVSPGNYIIRVTESNLQDQGYTSETVGFSLLTGGQGGYSELPAIQLRRIDAPTDREEQAIKIHNLTSKNSEPVIWDEDPEKRQNYFTLPTKDKVMAKHSLTQEKSFQETEKAEQDTNELPTPEEKRSNELSTDNIQTIIPAKKISFKKARRNNLGLPTISIKSPEPIELSTPDVTLAVPKQVIDSTSVIESFEYPDSTNTVTTIADNDNANTEITISETNNQVLETGRFVIQLGAFADEQVARDVMQELVNTNLPVQNFSLVLDTKINLYRLAYGRYLTRNNGLEFAAKNIGQAHQYFVRESLDN
jgi:hypothetical protein